MTDQRLNTRVRNQDSSTPSILDQSRAKGDKYTNYFMAIQKAQDSDNPDPSGVIKLAKEVIPRNLRLERERLGEPGNYQIALTAFNLGHQRAEADFESFMNTNLNTLIKDMSEKNLEALLGNVKLGAGTSQSFKIHQDFQGFYRDLANYQQKDDEEARNQALENMKEKLDRFYEANYSDDAQILGILKELSAIDEALRVARTQGFCDEKKQLLYDTVGKDRLGVYLKKSAKEEFPFYLMVCNVGRKNKH